MARSDPLILIRIVAKRLQKRKRAQTIPKDVLRLAKNQTARDNYMVGVFYESYNYDFRILYKELNLKIYSISYIQVRETVDNDNDVINEVNDMGEIENIVLDDEGNVDMGLNI